MQKPVYLTVSGLPLSFEFEWPFHKSTSGADYLVLHGTTWLEDGTGLRADFSIHLTMTMVDMLGSLEASHAQPYVINVVRKMIESKDIEFLRSGKRQPVQMSTRYKNFKTGGWKFVEPSSARLLEFMEETVYWVGYKLGGGKVLVTDPTNAIYLTATPEKLMDAARQLESRGMLKLEGEYAIPTETLIARSAELEQREQQALNTLQQKHAFEAAHKH